jgi:hypothetical protein
MNWLSNHFWLLFSGVGGTAVVALAIFLLEWKRRIPKKGLAFGDTTRTTVRIQDSQLTDSPVASGSQITQHNYYGSVTPPTPRPATSAPTKDKPRPNIQMTGARVKEIIEKEIRSGVFAENSLSNAGSARAFLIRFTNEAKSGGSNFAVFIRAALTYHNSDPVSLKIIGNWLTFENDAPKFLVDDSYYLIAGIKVAGSIAAPERRRAAGGYSAHYHNVPDLKSIFVRLTDANDGEVLYEGEFR